MTYRPEHLTTAKDNCKIEEVGDVQDAEEVEDLFNRQQAVVQVSSGFVMCRHLFYLSAAGCQSSWSVALGQIYKLPQV